MHHSPLSPALWKAISRPCAFAVTPEHHLLSHQRTGSCAVLAPAVHVTYRLCAVYSLQYPDLHRSPTSLIISHAPCSSHSRRFAQHSKIRQPYKYDMVHTYGTGNSIIRGSQVSRTAHSEQLPAPVFTAATPTPRGLRKPFNSSGAPPTTF